MTNHHDKRCDGILRRELLRVGGLTALGLSLSDFFALRAVADPASAKSRSASTKQPPNCILIWLDGGPSHLETFDLKPDAPSEVRGPFDPIATNVKGVRISEYLPRTAKQMDKVALIRSMTSTLGEHNFASHYLLTGYKPTPALRYPGLGAMATHLRDADVTLPAHIGLARPNGMAGRGYLPAAADPFVIEGDPSKPDFQVADLSLYRGVTKPRLERRRDFLAAIDAFHRDVDVRLDKQQRDGAAAQTNQVADPSFEQAYKLILSPQAKAAFDLSREPHELRQRYGRHSLGQSCLLARRLIEAGSRFVTITDRGWDTHENLFTRLKEGYTGGSVGKVPKLDTAYATLLEDLAARGLLDETLVILMGEFGRTPKLNPRGGRDHWPRAFSVALAGGGVRGGQVIGASDSRGETPADRPVTPADLAATIYTLLGIDPARELHTADGRPVRVNQDGKVVGALA